MLRPLLLVAISYTITNTYADDLVGKSVEQLKAIAVSGTDDTNAAKICSGLWEFKQYSACTPPSETIAPEAKPSISDPTCTPTEAPASDSSCPTYQKPAGTRLVPSGQYTRREMKLNPIICHGNCNQNDICPGHATDIGVEEGGRVVVNQAKSSDREVCEIHQMVGDGCAYGHYETTCVYEVTEPILNEVPNTTTEFTDCKKEVSYGTCRVEVCGTEGKLHYTPQGKTIEEVMKHQGVAKGSVNCYSCEGLPVDTQDQVDKKIKCLTRVKTKSMYKLQAVKDAVNNMTKGLMSLADRKAIQLSPDAADWMNDRATEQLLTDVPK